MCSCLLSLPNRATRVMSPLSAAPIPSELPRPERQVIAKSAVAYNAIHHLKGGKWNATISFIATVAGNVSLSSTTHGSGSILTNKTSFAITASRVRMR